MNENISELLMDLIEKAVNIHLDHLEQAVPVQPRLLIMDKKSGAFHISEIAEHEPGLTLAKARELVQQKAPAIAAYVIGYDGVMHTEAGERVPCLLYEAGQRGEPHGYSYAVGYRRFADGTFDMHDSYNGFTGNPPNLLHLPA